MVSGFLDLRFKVHCGIHTLSAIGLDERRGRILTCDGKGLNLWQLQETVGGDDASVHFVVGTKVPQGVKEVSKIYADSEYGVFLALAELHTGGSCAILVEYMGDEDEEEGSYCTGSGTGSGSGGSRRLSVKCGDALFPQDRIDAMTYNPRLHDLIVSTSRSDRRVRLRFLSVRGMKATESSQGSRRFVIIQRKEVALHTPKRTATPEAILASRAADALRSLDGNVDDDEESNASRYSAHIRSLALDLRTNYLFGSQLRSVLVWDAESGDPLFELHDMVPRPISTLAVLPGSDFIATAQINHEDKWSVCVWKIKADGAVQAQASFTNLHHVMSIDFADHSLPTCSRSQVALYITDMDKRVRCLAFDPDMASFQDLETLRFNQELTAVPAFDMRSRQKAFLISHPSLASYGLSSILALDENLYGLGFQSARSSYSTGPFPGTIVALQIITDASPLRPQGLLAVLNHNPNILYLLDRTTQQVLQAINLPASHRAFQLPEDTLRIRGQPQATCLRFIPLSCMVAIGYSDGRVDLINLQEGQRLHVLRSPRLNDAVSCLSWFPVDAAISDSSYTNYRGPICIIVGTSSGMLDLHLVHLRGTLHVASIAAHTGGIILAKPRYAIASFSGVGGTSPFCLITISTDGEVKTWLTQSQTHLSDWVMHGYIHIGTGRAATAAEMVSSNSLVIGTQEGALDLWHIPVQDTLSSMSKAGEGEEEAAPPIATVRRPLQSVMAHTGPITSVTLKTGTPRTRLIVTTSEDHTLVLFTYDGTRLIIFQRIMMTASLPMAVVDVDMPTSVPPLGDTPAVDWRLISAAPNYLNVLRRYHRPIEPLMAQKNSNSDSQINNILQVLPHKDQNPSIFQLLPFTSTIHTTLCAYRFARLKPSWLETPEERSAVVSPMRRRRALPTTTRGDRKRPAAAPQDLAATTGIEEVPFTTITLDTSSSHTRRRPRPELAVHLPLNVVDLDKTAIGIPELASPSQHGLRMDSSFFSSSLRGRVRDDFTDTSSHFLGEPLKPWFASDSATLQGDGSSVPLFFASSQTPVQIDSLLCSSQCSDTTLPGSSSDEPPKDINVHSVVSLWSSPKTRGQSPSQGIEGESKRDKSGGVKFIKSVAVFNVDKVSAPGVIRNYYVNSDLSYSLSAPSVNLAETTKTVRDLLSSYRKLISNRRRPVSIDRSIPSPCPGASVGFPIGRHEESLLKAIERMNRDQALHPIRVRDHHMQGLKGKRKNKKDKVPYCLPMVVLKEDKDGEEAIIWLDCSPEGDDLLLPEQFQDTALYTTTVLEPRAGRKTLDKKQQQQQQGEVQETNPMMVLYRSLKRDKDLLDFERLCTWDRLLKLMIDGYLSRSVAKSLYDEAHQGRNKGKLSFADFMRFNSLLEAHLAQVYEPTIIQSQIAQVTWNSFTIWVTVNKASHVYVAVVPRGTKPSLDDIKNCRGGIQNYGPIYCDRTDKSYEIQVTGLMEGTKYEVFFYAEHDLGPDLSMSGYNDELLDRYHQMGQTTRRPREAPYIEWDQLSKIQQIVEIQAATKDREVIEAAKRDHVAIPKAEEGHNKTFNEFRKWWSSTTNTEARETFLKREVNFVFYHEKYILDLASQDGIEVMPQDNEAFISDDDTQLTEEASRWLHFLSWYKGGQVFSDLIKDDPDLVTQKQAQRLSHRTDYLLRRCGRIDEVWAMIQDLIDAARQSREEKASGGGGGKERRMSWNRQRAEAVKEMKVKKLMELLKAKGLSAEDLLKISPDQLGRFNLFEDIDTSQYIPDTPIMPNGIITLHATEKRASTGTAGVTSPPIPKEFVSFQEMPADLGKLELKLAVMSPVVMREAIKDGIEVPELEDATSLLKSRQKRWARFLSWYIGDEDTYEERWLGAASQQGGQARDVRFVSKARQIVLDWEASMTYKDSSTRVLLGWEPDPALSEDDLMADFRKAYFNNLHVRKKYIHRQVARVLALRRAQVTIPLAWQAFPCPVVLFGTSPTPLEQSPPLRPRRMILFPTVNPELYSWEDVKGWYTKEELDLDMADMRQAELRQQMSTITDLDMEKQRLERIMMLWEDRRSEALLLAEGYLCTLEASRPAKSKNTKYCHTTDLVPNGDLALYRYPHGTGLECDAEIEGMSTALATAAEDEEKRRAEIRKNREEQERKKKEEEARRREEEERQLRMQQTQELRKSIVAHLAELKRRRQEEAEAQRAKAMEEARVKAAKEEEERMTAAKIKSLRVQEERREQEHQSLAKQQKLSSDKAREAREVITMRQEDYLSQRREREDREREEAKEERLEFLRYIYTPYRSIFMDDDFEAALWTGPQQYRVKERRRHVDPYCLPFSVYILEDPSRDTHTPLITRDELERRVSDSPSRHHQLRCCGRPPPVQTAPNHHHHYDSNSVGGGGGGGSEPAQRRRRSYTEMSQRSYDKMIQVTDTNEHDPRPGTVKTTGCVSTTSSSNNQHQHRFHHHLAPVRRRESSIANDQYSQLGAPLPYSCAPMGIKGKTTELKQRPGSCVVTVASSSRRRRASRGGEVPGRPEGRGEKRPVVVVPVVARQSATNT